ncbi:MAG: ribulose-phosphate 3-epimerase [Candidatus Cloacimonas sp.]|jgi:ribulose-phosphate 3-epimerase|nr:ribulose-phosphate 3-epimerase [Candidatus Cloacimonas sp.]
MYKTQIAPSLLSSDFGHLAKEIAALENAGADMLHLDVMDGHYVPNLSFGLPIIKAIRKLTKLPLDVHLMVTNPEFHVAELINLGVQWISFHQETVYHSHRLIQQIQAPGIKAGLALNPAIPINTLDSILPELDYVLLMSVNPGYSAQAFIPFVLEKVQHLAEIRRAKNLSFHIEVDGGITDKNAYALQVAGADILVSASYIFSSQDYQTAISTLKRA